LPPPYRPKAPLLILTGAAVIASGVYLLFPRFRDALHLAISILSRSDPAALKAYLLSFGAWAPLVSALLMVFQSIIVPLPAFVITFANGLLFGTFWGLLLSWSSAMVGAALCFHLSRALGRPVIERLVTPQALVWTDGYFHRFGNHAIVIARLVPWISFDLVSYAAGLTSMRFLGFWIATGIGQTPATILYTYLGHRASGSARLVFLMLSLLLALTVLIAALKPRLTRWITREQ
jgi:uncharacterized membrane protein YdjX (TVP38/TMEM64 family)